MIKEGGLRDMQDRPVWVTSGIHAFIPTEGGLRDMQDRPVLVTSGIHASIPMEGGLRDMQVQPVGITSGIHASICAGQQYMIFDLWVHLLFESRGSTVLRLSHYRIKKNDHLHMNYLYCTLLIGDTDMNSLPVYTICYVSGFSH